MPLDGRSATIAGFPDGNWVAPTVLTVTPSMRIYAEEVFGPVLRVLTVDTLEEAIALVNANPYGNGTAVFPVRRAARKLSTKSTSGRWNQSAAAGAAADVLLHGVARLDPRGHQLLRQRRGAVLHQWKTVTSNWKLEEEEELSLAMPIL